MPHLFLDGTVDASTCYNDWATMIESEIGQPSTLVMSMRGIYYPDSSSGYITVRIEAEQDPVLTNLRLRIALTESDIFWHAPNGGEWHHQTFRDMIPSASGQSITLVQGDSLEYTFPFYIADTVQAANCELAAFVQSNQNRRILQATKISVASLWLGGPCIFTPGDANNNDVFNGLDVSFSVNYLKGIGPAPADSCFCGSWGPICVAADINGDCGYNGLDISYAVNYLKGQGSNPRRCPDCAPGRD